MNREIKFRIWDNYTNRFVTCVYETNKDCYLFIGRSGYVTAFNCYGEEIDFQDGRFIIQQYTGLKDKNGKEIYEGDIVTFKPKSSKGPFWVIRYDSEHTMYVAKQNDWYVRLDCETDLPLPLKIEETIRVVGNVFENPELIKN